MKLRTRVATREARSRFRPRYLQHVWLVFIFMWVCVSFLGLDVPPGQAQSGSAYDLIAAVNQLRTSNGLPAYQINSALMAAAQAHSNYQASIGSVTHTGQGGSRARDRAAAAGYGGGATIYVSENIAGGMNLSYPTAVQSWQGDSLHLNTMLGENYQDVGAGVAASGNSVYYTLDVGYVAGSPAPPSSVSGTPGSTSPQASAVVFNPIFVATPKKDGSIVHEVQPGQALWNIAATYKIELAELLELNGLSENAFIFPGDKLTIRTAHITPSEIAKEKDVKATKESKTTKVKTSAIPPSQTIAPNFTLTSSQESGLSETTQPQQTEAPGSSPDLLLFLIGGLVFGGTTLIIIGNVLKRGG